MRIYRIPAGKSKRITVRGNQAVSSSIRFGRVMADSMISMTSAGLLATEFYAMPTNSGNPHFVHLPSMAKPKPQRPSKPTTVSEWLSVNADKLTRHAGKWVALAPKGVIATAETYEDVWDKSQRRGVLSPTVLKLSKKNAGPKAVSGKRP